MMTRSWMLPLVLVLVGCPEPVVAGDPYDDTALTERVEALETALAEAQDALASCASSSTVQGIAADVQDLQAKSLTSADLDGYLTDADLKGYAATSELSELYDLMAYLEVDTTDHAIKLVGANVYVQSGSGATNGDSSDPTRDAEGASVNGLGNLIVGYDEASTSGNEDKSGSHNLIVGAYHSYPSYGGIVIGYGSQINDQYAAVTGGLNNVASAPFASVAGGTTNQATGTYSVVSGGREGIASGYVATVSSGHLNTAGGSYSAVSGGQLNIANGESSAIGGGYDNIISGAYSAILGGSENSIDSASEYAVICGDSGIRINSTSGAVECGG